MELEDKIREIQGARIEDNRFCISVHYRQVPPEVNFKQKDGNMQDIV